MERIIVFKVLLLVYRALHDQVLECMRDMLKERTNVLQLAVPRSRLEGLGDRAFSIVASRLWNALPGSITECKSICAFKNVSRHICLHLLLKDEIYVPIYLGHVNHLRTVC